jgi:hypothetical protein
MQDVASAAVAYPAESLAPEPLPLEGPASARDAAEVVSTHVLVPADQVERLRVLAKRTRVAQSEYLREAVEDLLRKYGGAPEEP